MKKEKNEGGGKGKIEETFFPKKEKKEKEEKRRARRKKNRKRNGNEILEEKGLETDEIRHEFKIETTILTFSLSLPPSLPLSFTSFTVNHSSSDS